MGQYTGVLCCGTLGQVECTTARVGCGGARARVQAAHDHGTAPHRSRVLAAAAAVLVSCHSQQLAPTTSDPCRLRNHHPSGSSRIYTSQLVIPLLAAAFSKSTHIFHIHRRFNTVPRRRRPPVRPLLNPATTLSEPEPSPRRPTTMAFTAKPYCSTPTKPPTLSARAPRSAHGLSAAAAATPSTVRLRAFAQRIRAQSQQQQQRRRRPEYVPHRIDDPNYVRIFDTTLRDGEQSPGATMTSAEKLVVARQLARLGVDIIEAGFPASSPDDLDAVRSIAIEVGNPVEEGAHVPVICGLSRCNKRDIDAAWEAVRNARRPRIHTFIATSEIHMQHKLRKTPEQVVAIAKEMVAYARSLGCPDVEFSPEDAGRYGSSQVIGVSRLHFGWSCPILLV